MGSEEKDTECVVCKDETKIISRNWFICSVCESTVCYECVNQLKNTLCPCCREERAVENEKTEILAYSYMANKYENTLFSKILYFKLAKKTRHSYGININAQKQFLMLCQKGEAYYYMANFFLIKCTRDKRIEYLEKSVEVKEDEYYSYALTDLVNIYWSKKKNDQAIEMLMRVDVEIFKYKISNEIMFKLAKVYFNKEDYENSFKIFKLLEIINIDEGNARKIFHYLGYMYNNGLGVQKDTTKAFTYYTICLGEGKKDNKIKNKIMDMIDGIKKLK